MPSAILEAEAVRVLCPHCQEPQGVPGNGSQMWLPEDIERCLGKRGLSQQVCDHCGRKYTLMFRNIDFNQG